MAGNLPPTPKNKLLKSYKAKTAIFLNITNRKTEFGFYISLVKWISLSFVAFGVVVFLAVF